jgi:hypothetical protein
MRKVLPPVVLVTVVAIAVIAVNAIGASASPTAAQFEPWGRHLMTDAARAAASAPPAVAGERIVLHTRPGQAKFVDADHNGKESNGDYVVFTERFFNASGQQVGRDRLICTINFRTFQCQATLFLDGRGTIEAAGTLTDRIAMVAITGGTGEFADAGGEINAGRSETLVLNLLHLAG